MEDNKHPENEFWFKPSPRKPGTVGVQCLELCLMFGICLLGMCAVITGALNGPPSAGDTALFIGIAAIAVWLWHLNRTHIWYTNFRLSEEFGVLVYRSESVFKEHKDVPGQKLETCYIRRVSSYKVGRNYITVRGDLEIKVPGCHTRKPVSANILGLDDADDRERAAEILEEFKGRTA